MKPDWNPDNLKPLVGHKICPIADALLVEEMSDNVFFVCAFATNTAV